MSRWLFVLMLLAPSTAWSQGFVNQQGYAWAKLDYSQWTADERFAGIFDRNPSNGIELGDPIPFDESTGGEFTNRAVALSVEWVPLSRWVIGAYFPFYQESRFVDSVFDTTTVGTGDIFLHTGYQIASTKSVGTTIYAHWKIPTTTLPTEFDSVPLSEGQHDVALEQSTTFAPLPRLHLTLSTLLRKRLEFVDGDRTIKPGDEFELGFEVGGAFWAPLWLKASYDGLWSTGREDRSGSGAVTLSERRIVHNATVGAYFRFGAWLPEEVSGLALDTTFTYPLAGQDFPRGPSFSAGLAFALP